MATGRSNKLVGATGEYLVAAELSRRGLIATTFTGNVPHYDIIASDESGRHVSVQVKASSGSSWMFGDVSRFFDLAFSGQRQSVGGSKKSPVAGLIVVFVAIGRERDDRFYVLTWEQLRDLAKSAHANYLEKHGGIRPKKWDSKHTAIVEKQLESFKDRWDVLESHLR
jgi:hypothetical protein